MDKKIEDLSAPTSADLSQQSMMIHDGGQSAANSALIVSSDSASAGNSSKLCLMPNCAYFLLPANNTHNNNKLVASQQPEESSERLEKENSEFRNAASVPATDGEVGQSDDLVKKDAGDDLEHELLQSAVVDVDLKTVPLQAAAAAAAANNTVQTDDSNGAIALNAVDCKRHQVAPCSPLYT